MMNDGNLVTVNQLQNIILENRKSLHVSGVREVSVLDDTYALIQTVMGELEVRGENLHMIELSVGTGELFMEGRISDMCYREKAEKVSLRERLFG